MTDELSSVTLHNVAELADPEWTADSGGTPQATDGEPTTAARELRRVPTPVAARLNVAARERVRHPAGSEIRFVPTGEDPVRITLSASEATVARPFWGAFQGAERLEIDDEPTSFELSPPEALGGLDPAAAPAADEGFDPRVCRLRFEPWARVAVHEVRGPCRPPDESETPATRYLAYGTSITEGAAASATHLTYVSRVARELGLDPVNLGMSGSAYCEPAVAEHVAARDDWDVATLSLSVNMANRGFTVEQFRERARTLVTTVAKAHPDKPVACITLFPYHADLQHTGDRERARAYRNALATVVEGCEAGRVTVVDGSDLTPATGLTTDLLHPGDAGMEAIADGVARHLRDRLST